MFNEYHDDLTDSELAALLQRQTKAVKREEAIERANWDARIDRAMNVAKASRAAIVRKDWITLDAIEAFQHKAIHDCSVYANWHLLGLRTSTSFGDRMDAMEHLADQGADWQNEWQVREGRK